MTKTNDEVLAGVKSWLSPISAEAPAGVSAKFDIQYEALRKEVLKLDSPRAEPVSWRLVVDSGAEIISSKSKDLLIAAHLAYALFPERGLPGLWTGTVFLVELLKTYWDGMFPPLARLRGRVGALEWFVDKAAAALSQATADATAREALEGLSQATADLKAVVQEKFGTSAPSISSFSDGVTRLLLALPKEAAPAAAAAATPAPAPAAAPATTPLAGAPAEKPAPAEATQVTKAPAAPATPAPVLAPPAAAAENSGELSSYLGAVGEKLVVLAQRLRAARPSSAMAYRLMRVGLWLPLSAPPQAGSDGNSMVRPLNAELRASLDAQAEAGSWPQVLKGAEGGLAFNALNIDLQRLVARALGALGEEYAPARREVIGELRTLLERFPTLTRLRCEDGTPLCDENSRVWLQEEVLVKAGASSAGSSSRASDDSVSEESIAKARELLQAGKMAEAVALFQPLVAAARDARTRFRVRLAQADVCRKAGLVKVAHALYEALEAEANERHLEGWEPGLVLDCLVGYLLCARADKDRAGDGREAIIFSRIAGLAPSLALELGT